MVFGSYSNIHVWMSVYILFFVDASMQKISYWSQRPVSFFEMIFIARFHLPLLPFTANLLQRLPSILSCPKSIFLQIFHGFIHFYLTKSFTFVPSCHPWTAVHVFLFSCPDIMTRKTELFELFMTTWPNGKMPWPKASIKNMKLSSIGEHECNNLCLVPLLC